MDQATLRLSANCLKRFRAASQPIADKSAPTPSGQKHCCMPDHSASYASPLLILPEGRGSRPGDAALVHDLPFFVGADKSAPTPSGQKHCCRPDHSASYASPLLILPEGRGSRPGDAALVHDLPFFVGADLSAPTPSGQKHCCSARSFSVIRKSAFDSARRAWEQTGRRCACT
ncbi:putative dienelactone hydrolase [Pseudomonas sp. PvP100]|nr:putative dienelactone hydrolase [Pseudomonas sp. PvP007]MBP1196166.1 putative dienelactone hydrolase [Pseudomonas sp. PvP100]